MSDNNDPRRKVVEKIAALLAKATSLQETANLHSEEAAAAYLMEAASYSEKAHALLAEHNLSMSDLGVREEDILHDNDLLTYFAGWIKPVMNSVAKLFFCGYYYESFPTDFIKRQGFDKIARKLFVGANSRTYLRHNFIGKDVNVLVAKQMAEYLISAMERACKESQTSVPAKERGAFRYSFMNACAARLCRRLLERQLQTSATGVHEGKTNLPALRSLYEQAQDMFDKWAEANVPQMTKKKSLTRISHEKGARAGLVAGDRIGLDEQIDTGHKNRVRLTA
jgi:hypothetical protein